MSIQQAFNATLASGATAATALRFAYQHSPQYEAASNEYKAKQLEKKANEAEKRSRQELAASAKEAEAHISRTGNIPTSTPSAEVSREQQQIANELRARAFDISPNEERYKAVSEQKKGQMTWANVKKKVETESLARMREAQEQQKAQNESLEIRKGILKGTSSEIREWRESFKKEGESK